MKKTRKFLAFILAMGLMLSSMTVFAAEAESDSATEESEAEESEAEEEGSSFYWYSGGIVDTKNDDSAQWVYYGFKPVSGDGYIVGDLWYDVVSDVVRYFNGVTWVNDAESKAMVDWENAKTYQEEAEAAGFTDVAQMQYAEAAHKNAGEYYNNAVMTTPGIENAIPVAQGGKLVIDGKVTNATATISKVTVAYVDSVRAAQEGTVLNVVDVSFPSHEATINFYMPGVADGANIVALQYVNGSWVNVDVVEVRADHVVLNMTNDGVVAFVAK